MLCISRATANIFSCGRVVDHVQNSLEDEHPRGFQGSRVLCDVFEDVVTHGFGLFGATERDNCSVASPSSRERGLYGTTNSSVPSPFTPPFPSSHITQRASSGYSGSSRQASKLSPRVGGSLHTGCATTVYPPPPSSPSLSNSFSS